LREPSRPKPAIPDHELLRPIGVGSYGEVWLARTVIGSARAVKIVHRAAFDDDRPYEREFSGIQKFEPISRSHEGFVDLLQVGRNDAQGCFYYVMELADDANAGQEPRPLAPERNGAITSSTPVLPYTPRTLASDLKTGGALPVDDCLRIARALASAVAELHRHGLVHRDIKPSNIIFVGGVPKLADIGLVSAANEARSFVGTEGFIPPEGPGTPRADLYSLGVVLYMMSTGKSHREFPEPPALLLSQPDHERRLDLQAIVYRACAPEPRERYDSAEALLADLLLLEAGQSVKQRHSWQRKRKVVWRVGLAGIGLLAVGAIGYWGIAAWSPRPQFVGSTNDLAFREYREGIHELLAQDNPVNAIEHFRAAVRHDPRFAEAYARMAVAWISAGGATNIPNARRAAEQALALDKKSAVAHAAMATVKLSELDWTGAEKERRLALKLGPGSEQILLESALNLAVMGKTKEALAMLDRANHANADASSNARLLLSGFVYAWSRQYDRALEIFDRFPTNGGWWMHEQQVQVYLAKGDYPNAIRLAKVAAREREEDPAQVNAEFDRLQEAFRQGGPEKYWERKLEFEQAKKGEDSLMRTAAACAQLGRMDKAFEYLGRAMNETPPNFTIAIYTNPAFDELRQDKRFVPFVKELWRPK
jgi:tetratricopeptide (TPR) repeat protein